MLDLFLSGFFTEHLVLSKGLGLALFAFLPYTRQEAGLSALRFSLFLPLLVGAGLISRGLFSGPLFFLSFAAGIHGLISLFLNILLPQTRFKPKLEGILKRGDALAFLCFSDVLGKNLPPAESFLFTLGGILGTAALLILMAAFLEAFNLHRKGPLRASAWRMGVLAVLSFLIS